MWMAACLSLIAGMEPEPPESAVLMVVVGEPGEEQYEKMFVEWAGRWRDAAEKGGVRSIAIGLPESKSSDRDDRDLLTETLASLEEKTPETLWIVMIGHGTFDGKKAKFNLRGPDITATELAAQLEPLSCRMAIVNCASASAPFVNRLSGPNRVVVSATKSGSQYNFARFGGYLSQMIGDVSADLDKDGQTSLLEAWLAAAKQTQEYYDSKSQLATEHSILDDNGDGKGTPADFFRGIHLVKTSQDDTLPDGTFANQFILVPGEDQFVLSDELRRQRDQLERQLAQLRQQKDKYSEIEYLHQLEKILVPLAEIYRKVEELAPSQPETDDPS
ncbi:MAG: hypothetical protein HUJ26_15435 [Planctomycetaceae bacterium]|nr:hypothetical protein [Planctomycetaceae bacterium]